MAERTFVVDTNVILVAGERHGGVSPSCVATCARKLQAIMDSGRIALDDGYEVLREYQNKTNPHDAKGPGDAFVKWALRNHTNPTRCDMIQLDRVNGGEFAAFPQHPDLLGFDPADKKFVAISNAHPHHPPILEAADSKWLDWAPALHSCGIAVELLCVDDMQRFHEKKLGS